MPMWARTNADLWASADRRALELRASADIAAGEELLTAYHYDEDGGDERARIKTVLQYGMPADGDGTRDGPAM